MPCISVYTSSLKGVCKYSLWVNGRIAVALYSINQSEETAEKPVQTENSSMISSPIRLWTNHCPTMSLLKSTFAGSRYVVYIYDNKVHFLSQILVAFVDKNRVHEYTKIQEGNLQPYSSYHKTVINIDWEPPRFYFLFLTTCFVLVTYQRDVNVAAESIKMYSLYTQSVDRLTKSLLGECAV